jgi:hypothetical protein
MHRWRERESVGAWAAFAPEIDRGLDVGDVDARHEEQGFCGSGS